MQLTPLLTTLTLLLPFTTANYATGKAVQINFYTNAVCSAYAGEMAFWHQYKGTPEIQHFYDFNSPDGNGDCHDFTQPAGTQSLNLAQCWDISGNNKAKGQYSCSCTFWDNWGCTGNAVEGTGNCMAGRSGAGWQWKSAKCWHWN